MNLVKMKTSDVAVDGRGLSGQVRHVGTKTFVYAAETWTDSAFDPAKNLPEMRLVFGSEALLQLLSADRELAAYAALGKNVVAVHKGKVYRIVSSPSPGH
jgi:hypothetical protein